MRFALFIIIVVSVCATSALAAPTLSDLSQLGSNATINGGYFITSEQRSTGTGVIQSFVRLKANSGEEEGYNTDARPVQYDENTSHQFTRSLPLSIVPLVDVHSDGTLYREFLLDINQNKSAPDYYLSLDQLKIWLNPNPAVNDDTTLGSPIYNLDGAGDSRIVLDYRNNEGSGSGDMVAYIPDSLFTGEGDYVYLYSKFGEWYDGYNELSKKDYKDWDKDYTVNSNDYYPNNDGFEEWAVQSPTLLRVIPAPAAILLVGVGLGGLDVMRRKKLL